MKQCCPLGQSAHAHRNVVDFNLKLCIKSKSKSNIL
jgi:hypothetical protein